MRFAPVDARDTAVEALLARHQALMQSQSPAESCHVLSSDALRAAGATVYALWQEAELLAVGALKPFGTAAVELKSMHVAQAARGRGLGGRLLTHLLDAARAGGALSAWLETGAQPEFTAARALYLRAGFAPCPPFGDYRVDPLSVFMTRAL